MTEIEARKILHSIGKEFKQYYLELFKNKKTVRLLIDIFTFSSICEKLNILDTYREAYCLIKLDYKGGRSDEEYYELIALAIAVYQVLIYYDVTPDLNNEEAGYYSQLSLYYPDAEISPNFFEQNQDALWLSTQNLFSKEGKEFKLPEIRNNAGRYVQYPKEQRILTIGQLRKALTIFSDLEEELTYEKLISHEGFRNCHYNDYENLLLYQTYTSYLKNPHLIKSEYRKGNDIKVSEIINISEDGHLYNTNDITIECSDAISSYFYYWPELECFRNLQKNDTDQVGRIINIKKAPVETTIPSFDFKLQDPSYVLRIYDVNQLKDLNPTLYNRFFKSQQINSNCPLCEFKGGLLLDGRSNEYDHEYLPELHFNFTCKRILLKSILGIEEIKISNNILQFDTLKLSEGNYTLILPEKEYQHLNFVISSPKKSKIECTKGWDIVKLAPASQPEDFMLHGLKYKIPNQQDFQPRDNIINPKKIKSKEYFIENKFIDCSFIGEIELNEPIKDSFCRLLKHKLALQKNEPQAVFHLINKIRMKISSENSLKQFISFYRLLKKYIYESYKNKEYDQEMIVLFYGGNDDKTLIPYISKVEYVEGIYDNQIKPYFNELTIPGWRPKAENINFTIDLQDKNNLQSILKNKLCSNISFTCSSDCPIHDYLEFYEVFIRLQDNCAVIKDGKYEISFTKRQIAPTNLQYTFDFSQKVNYKDPSESLPDDVKFKNKLLYKAQKILHKYLTIKGPVTWGELVKFIYKNLNIYLSQIENNSNSWKFMVFMPLYEKGFIDVCYVKDELRYYAQNLEVLPYTIDKKIKFNKSFYPKAYSDVIYVNSIIYEEVLSILKKIPALTEIIHQWTPVPYKNNLLSVWNFSESKFIEQKSKMFGLMREEANPIDCDFYKTHTYFAFSEPENTKEVFIIPDRNKNPNAERIAKIMQRSLENDNSRMSYNKTKKLFTCKARDIPIPILRLLCIIDPLFILLPSSMSNEKKDYVFLITDEIYKQLQRIFNNNTIREE